MYDEEELKLYLKEKRKEYKADVDAYLKTQTPQLQTADRQTLASEINYFDDDKDYKTSARNLPDELTRYLIKTEKEKITFQDKLKEYLRERNLKDTDVYKAVGMSEKIFNKAKNAGKTSVSVDTAVMISIGLQLTLEQMDEMLNLTGKSLRRDSTRDNIIRFFFDKENYNIDDLNNALVGLNQKPLGCVKDDKNLIEM